jgi:hypothetical protein
MADLNPPTDSCHMATEHTAQLSTEEIFERARSGCRYIKKGFDVWVHDIRPAVVICRKIADERGGKKTFDNLLESHGIDISKHDASRLLRIDGELTLMSGTDD